MITVQYKFDNWFRSNWIGNSKQKLQKGKQEKKLEWFLRREKKLLKKINNIAYLTFFDGLLLFVKIKVFFFYFLTICKLRHGNVFWYIRDHKYIIRVENVSFFPSLTPHIYLIRHAYEFMIGISKLTKLSQLQRKIFCDRVFFFVPQKYKRGRKS